ncbi:uncharacterized protein C1orf50 homolog [Periplaneta americana]|uniref:uncharacterized protein C1orf50 homolog n=1 Tax=Periplaneta americana TaxID=6978 RepID=UPI0037E7A50D
MKRRIVNMDPEEFSKLKCVGAESIVERNVSPQGTELVNPFAVAKHDSVDLVELAQGLQKADDMVKATATSQLQMIANQMRFLQEQARKVLLEAKLNADLHHAACNFRKLPGHIYYLYERPSGQQYLSMLSPEDWKCSSAGPPHQFIGAYLLERDLSWTPEELIHSRKAQVAVQDKLFDIDVLKALQPSKLLQRSPDVHM